jgi:hypothetical protein
MSPRSRAVSVFLVIDPAISSPRLEHRLISVADALYESAHPVRSMR